MGDIVGGVSASELTVSAGRNIQLENDLNRFHSVVVNGTDGIVSGDVNIASHALSVEYGYPSEVPSDDNNLYVTVNAGIAGEQSFTNLDGGGVEYRMNTELTGAGSRAGRNINWRFGSHVGNDDINWLTDGVLSIEPHMMHRMDSNFRLGTGLVFYAADDLLSYTGSAGEGEVEEEKSVRNALPGEIVVVP